MYNFGIPSTLKAYFTTSRAPARPSATPRRVPVGLLTGKRAVVFATRGRHVRRHAARHAERLTCASSSGFLGITDVEFVYAEGLAMGEAPRNAALGEARRTIEPALGGAPLG
jgi:FMN-dependent NADH-azoreductase